MRSINIMGSGKQRGFALILFVLILRFQLNFVRDIQHNIIENIKEIFANNLVEFFIKYSYIERNGH